MLVVIACPECGHFGRVPEKRLGHKVRCKGCGLTFRPDAAATHVSPESEKAPRKAGSEKKTKEARAESAWLGLLKNPTVIDGAVMGAIAGIMTGVLIGAITEVIYAEAKKGVLFESPSQSPIGSAIGGGIIGFIKGFIGGSLIGALLGLISVYFQADSLAKSWGRIVAFGILIGAAITVSIVAMFTPSHYEWLAAGGFVGAVGALIWFGLQAWEKASDQPIVSDFQLEEDEKPTAPKIDL